MPSYLPIMQYCEDRTLREELYYQYSTRASELSKNIKLDNTEIIKNILISYKKSFNNNFCIIYKNIYFQYFTFS